ncbi:acyl-CoA/acyl-ACP dehydrogenase [Streptomyces sp. MC1]|uniref:acyl-CoA dehydrogenase family protein n=1 Tax=Streptomyces sp. MC1 TaxID=295105 RepID=UPI0018CAA7DD|nr:acyl-CoA dehydrogenase family protein [Streptomyces sp. MC1]MBG7704680.1 acyl-CoA/acyl-ACP dehydrogenase [Streptomyces sp. MC1]
MSASVLAAAGPAVAPARSDRRRRFAERTERVAAVAAEHSARSDTESTFPAEALAELRHTGLLGLMVPSTYGGLDGDIADMVQVSMDLGRADMSVAMIFAMHCQQVAAVVRHARPALRDRLLPEIAGGRRYLASVTTEAGTGGHLLSAQSPLEASDCDLVIDRFAPVVTGGAYADGYLITMLAPNAASPAEVSLVYADRQDLDVTVKGDWQALGMRASHSLPLQLTGRVPADRTIGEEGDFRTVMTSTFAPMAHLGWSAAWLGTAAGALSRVLRLLRSPGGRARTDLHSELLLSRLSRARRRLDQVHALLTRTQTTVAETADLSRPAVQLQLNALKITASEECLRAVDDLIDAVGMRHGYLKGSPTRLEQALRDLRSAALNYHNDRLDLVDGKLALLDPEVTFV